MPAKRSEPIILHAQTRNYGSAWVANFARERDLVKILTGIEAFCEATDGAFDETSPAATLAAVQARFVAVTLARAAATSADETAVAPRLS